MKYELGQMIDGCAVVELLPCGGYIGQTYRGSKLYYNKDGEKHNLIGPAVIYTEDDIKLIGDMGGNVKVYYINDEKLTEERFLQYKRDLIIDKL